jgi:hypothetical protein
LKNLPDMEISYVEGDLQSDLARALLASEAKNPHCLLTVAVCDDSPDSALDTALNLPREVYPQSKDYASEHIPRILVRLEHSGSMRSKEELGHFLSGPETRYACVQPFGWQEQSVPAWCLQRFSVLAGSWFYKHKDWEKIFVNGEVDDIDLNGMRREAFDLYKETALSLLWANVYTLDSLSTVFRQLGFKAVQSDEEQDFKRNLHASRSAYDKLRGPLLRDFARAEHNRWMADRILMGYLPHATKDNTYRWHNCLINFDGLSEENVRKDESSVKCRIFTLAMMGYHIKPA